MSVNTPRSAMSNAQCLTAGVTRHIQSVERAAAVLRTLASAPYDLSLQEVAESLDLAKPTLHGLLATLRHVGLVEQDRRTGHYRLVHEREWFTRVGVDPHDLRSHAMNWADRLAATTGLAVLVGVPGEYEVEIAHHVFCPDGSPQTLLYGERQPAHATALGKVLLASTRWWQVRMLRRPLERCTGRTVVDRDLLRNELDGVRRAGHAVSVGERSLDEASVAAPLRGSGGLGVGALAVVGPVDAVCTQGGAPRPGLVPQVVAAARAVSAGLEDRR